MLSSRIKQKNLFEKCSTERRGESRLRTIVIQLREVIMAPHERKN